MNTRITNSQQSLTHSTCKAAAVVLLCYFIHNIPCAAPAKVKQMCSYKEPVYILTATLQKTQPCHTPLNHHQTAASSATTFSSHTQTCVCTAVAHCRSFPVCEHHQSLNFRTQSVSRSQPLHLLTSASSQEVSEAGAIENTKDDALHAC